MANSVRLGLGCARLSKLKLGSGSRKLDSFHLYLTQLFRDLYFECTGIGSIRTVDSQERKERKLDGRWVRTHDL